jgi:hypothetical protein
MTAEEPTAAKFGARVYFHNDGVIQVCQTVLRNGRYVIDTKDDGKLKEKWVNPGEDATLTAAVRSAGKGEL